MTFLLGHFGNSTNDGFDIEDYLLIKGINDTDNLTNNHLNRLPCNYLKKNNLTEEYNKQCRTFEMEIPIPTEISVAVVILFLFVIGILKLFNSPRESTLSENKYDLILFKETLQSNSNKKKSSILDKTLFDNSKVRAQNLRSLKESGFDDRTLVNKFAGINSIRKRKMMK